MNTVPSSLNCPSPRDYCALAGGGIPRSSDDNTTFVDSSFPIIFDSGVSLAISPDKSDFVVYIQPVDLRLVGMSNRMIIEGE